MGRRVFLATAWLAMLGFMQPALAQSAASDIEKIQQFLTDRGCDPNGIDGQWGGGSRRAAERYFAVSGVMLGADSAIEDWPERFLQPTCGDDISLAPAGQLADYRTPGDTIELPGGIVQHNWIPAGLRDFDWPEDGALLVDASRRLAHFTKDSLKAMGCVGSGMTDLDYLKTQLLEHDISLEGQAKFPLITTAGDFLVPAICSGNAAPLKTAESLLYEWARKGAFEGYGLREEIRKNRNSRFVNDYASSLVSLTLVTREELAQHLTLWLLVKSALPDLNAARKQVIESWFERLVAEQTFTYAETPLDCPSFSAMPKGLRVPGYMRGNQFEECINTGTSRSGISALWALVSGDRSYAEDALNTYFMTLNLLRADGSHMLESARGEIAHYKAQFNLSWMLLVAEAFGAVGIDLYSVEARGNSILNMAEFLAVSAVDTELTRYYSGASRQENRTFKDASQWVILSRFPNSRAARLILRQIAATTDIEQLHKKLFLLNPPGDRASGTSFREGLLPFAGLFGPADVISFVPATARREILNEKGFCPDMGWTQADEQFAGEWNFKWGIFNIFSNRLELQGVDVVKLEDGRGEFLKHYTQNPRKEISEFLQIAYGNGRICVGGMLNLFDPLPLNLVLIQGTFDDGLATGKWPDGDEFRIEMIRKP